MERGAFFCLAERMGCVRRDSLPDSGIEFLRCIDTLKIERFACVLPISAMLFFKHHILGGLLGKKSEKILFLYHYYKQASNLEDEKE
jgi:hypothetical protein